MVFWDVVLQLVRDGKKSSFSFKKKLSLSLSLSLRSIFPYLKVSLRKKIFFFLTRKKEHLRVAFSLSKLKSTFLGTSLRKKVKFGFSLYKKLYFFLYQLQFFFLNFVFQLKHSHSFFYELFIVFFL